MVNKIVCIPLVILTFMLLLTNGVQAKNNTTEVSDSSAKIEASASVAGLRQSKEYILKKMVIKRVLKRYDSPLIEEVDAFVDACYVNNLDCYLVPSIAGLESTFGRRIAPNTYNPFGWGGGYIKFETWGDAIHTVAGGLRENYIGRGAATVSDIGRVYAPPSSTWGGNVKKLMNTFEREEEKVTNIIEAL